MHLDGFDLSGDSEWSEGNNHTGLEDSSLDSSDWDCSNTSNLVDILEWESEWLLRWSLWWVEVVKSSEESWSLVPWHVRGWLKHVVSLPTGDWDEWHGVDLVSDLLEVGGELRLDLIVSLLAVLDGGVVHLVDSNNHLLDSHGLGEKSMLSGLSLLGETSLETTSVGGNHEDGGISLGGSSDHVLDEISVSWGIDDGENSLLRLEFPEGNIDGDTTLTLSLKLVEYPSVLERGLSELSGFLLELGDSSLIDTSALVDKVTS